MPAVDREVIMNAVCRANMLFGRSRLDEAFETIELLNLRPEAAQGAVYLQASIAMWAVRWLDAAILLDELLRLSPEVTELRIGGSCLHMIFDQERMRLELAGTVGRRETARVDGIARGPCCQLTQGKRADPNRTESFRYKS